MHPLSKLSKVISACRKCPRLVAFRENTPKRASYSDQPYLRQPTPGFGDRKARLLILGLAPSAHGGNRTGRIFTGDESAKFLMKMLHQTGFANQSTSTSLNDGLELKDCYITAVVKCVPPQNRPLKKESDNCLLYLEQEIALLPRLKAVLTLGKFSHDAWMQMLNKKYFNIKKMPFVHGACLLAGPYQLFCSYHPSPQNTYTKKLTEKMFLLMLNKIKSYLDF